MQATAYAGVVAKTDGKWKSLISRMHNGMEQVFYTCKLPGTSGTLLLQECPEQNGTFATIKMQANVSHVWKIKISFIRKQHKENKTIGNDIHI